jgi:hypothetical protein
MASAKNWHHGERPHSTDEAEATGWVMIVILLASAAFALFCLWSKVRG